MSWLSNNGSLQYSSSYSNQKIKIINQSLNRSIANLVNKWFAATYWLSRMHEYYGHQVLLTKSQYQFDFYKVKSLSQFSCFTFSSYTCYTWCKTSYDMLTNGRVSPSSSIMVVDTCCTKQILRYICYQLCSTTYLNLYGSQSKCYYIS